MYESPIEVMYGEMHSKMVKDEEDRIMYEVNRQVGVHVDREQMLKALQYDRNQYDKGYKDALVDMQHLTDLVKDFNPAEIAHHIEMGNLAEWCNIFQSECERVLNGGNNNQ